MNRGVATFTLDTGHCPPWLFARMVKLGRAMTEVIVQECGPGGFIERLGDPVWFQSLGTVYAFDWNASGLTTVLTAALKEAVRGREKELGIFICGGKGKTSRKTPAQIRAWGEALGLPDRQVDNLEYNSRISAKVDSALVQDQYQLYHHSFCFSRDGAWTVIQQGMNQQTRTARRYHWHSKSIDDLVVEPHQGIVTAEKSDRTLNLTHKKSQSSRDLSVSMLDQSYQSLVRDLAILDRHVGSYSRMIRVADKSGQKNMTLLELDAVEFKHHPVEHESFANSSYLKRILFQLHEDTPVTYEQLLARPGVGPKTIRALALVGEVLYGAKPSYQDPARYSFAHGGKDTTPYPVDQTTYDKTIQTLQQLVARSRLNYQDKTQAMGRLQGVR